MSMSSRFVRILINKRNWTAILSTIFLVSAAGLIYIGYQTHAEAPPIPDFVDEDGLVILSKEKILDGQVIFQQKALMSYGSMFGDGALRGPDFTAEALHYMGQGMRESHARRWHQEHGRAPSPIEQDGIARAVIHDIKTNRYDRATNQTLLTPTQVDAFEGLVQYYTSFFTDPDHPRAFKPINYIHDEAELRSLTAFFFWGAWVCGTQRPQESWSYTHNWPFDETVGNTATGPTILWSIFGILALLLGLGVTLYVYGQFQELPGDPLHPPKGNPFDTDVSTPTQRAAFGFFVLSVILFLLQVLAGILTISDFVGIDISQWAPITISRSLHTQLALLWIASAWMGATIFILPFVTGGKEPGGQILLVRTLLAMLVIISLGGFVGIVLGPTGFFGEYWNWLGHQGWEYMEAGRLWQKLLFISIGLWAVILIRGLWSELKSPGRWKLPEWLVYCVVGILLLFISGFVFTPRTNFVIADFWRWMVVHMWVEAFFEVFTTIVVAYVLVLMGVVNRTMAERAIFLAAILFLGSGLLGISHNFYWNAKPTGTLALGAVFSTLQIVPLVLLTIDAWKLQRTRNEKNPAFGGVWLFILAVNFWNFLGAGVFGFIINLPVINYFQHGSYLTVNHAHAALMGVYGNLSIAAILFCCYYLIPIERWNEKLIRVSFWSINSGLALMLVLDLLPVGIVQLNAIFEHGYWWARSEEFINSTSFQTLTWLRAIGANIFFWGGLLPVVWFVISRAPSVGSHSKGAEGSL